MNAKETSDLSRRAAVIQHADDFSALIGRELRTRVVGSPNCRKGERVTQAMPSLDRKRLIELTATVVSAYVTKHAIRAAELPALIGHVHAALNNTGNTASAPVATEKPKPAVPVRKSVQDDQIICLECGNRFKSLKRHLMTNHGASPDEYREKWELPSNYPMVTPDCAQARSRLAREMGLGRKRLAK